MVATIQANAHNRLFMHNYWGEMRQRVINYYLAHDWDDRLIEGPYINPRGIIDYIVTAVISLSSEQAA